VQGKDRDDRERDAGPSRRAATGTIVAQEQHTRVDERFKGRRDKAAAPCICTRDFVYPVCGPVITGGNKPIPRYGGFCLNMRRDLLP